MKKRINASILFLVLLLFCCTNVQDNGYKKNDFNRKKIIDVVDINAEFHKRLNLNGEGVKTEFFDLKNKIKRGDLVKSDTFFIKINYVSDTFLDLVKNHEIELLHSKGDFKFSRKVSKNKYEIVTGGNPDTIEYDVFLKSKKYIFNDYFLENGEIKYKLVDKISLCRLKNIIN